MGQSDSAQKPIVVDGYEYPVTIQKNAEIHAILSHFKNGRVKAPVADAQVAAEIAKLNNKIESLEVALAKKEETKNDPGPAKSENKKEPKKPDKK